MAQNRFQKQTHFVGILPPEGLSEAIENCRAWMAANFGCKSGHATPVHITIVPPFALEGEFMTRRLVRTVQSAAEELISVGSFPFTARVGGFGAFGDRTIFAKVEQGDGWNRLREKITHAIQKEFPKIRRDTRAYQPHMTVANRDIPPGAAASALSYFSELDVSASFATDNIAVFTRNGAGGWNALDENVIRLSEED